LIPPPSYRGSRLHSLEKAANEEFLGSFVGITASFITFFRHTELPIYIKIAEALEDLDPRRLSLTVIPPIGLPATRQER
jgi:hypothetical protein